MGYLKCLQSILDTNYDDFFFLLLSITGTIVLMLILSLSFVLTISMRSFQFQQLLRKDERLRKIIEAVTHLKIIKLNVWEETFDSQVDELRAKELTSIRMFLTLQVKNNGPKSFTSK